MSIMFLQKTGGPVKARLNIVIQIWL